MLSASKYKPREALGGPVIIIISLLRYLLLRYLTTFESGWVDGWMDSSDPRKKKFHEQINRFGACRVLT